MLLQTMKSFEETGDNMILKIYDNGTHQCFKSGNMPKNYGCQTYLNCVTAL